MMTILVSFLYLYFVVVKCGIDDNRKNNSTATYNRLINCINYNTFSKKKDSTNLNLPLDLEDHYKLIIRETSKLRNLNVHSYAGYSGPWIENHFITNFMGKDLSFFNGLVPLFIQWVDMHANEFLAKDPKVPPLKYAFHILKKILRYDVLYVTVSQDDEGIFELQQLFPNILTLSGGGYGHIPIPLIKGELSYIPPKPKFVRDIGFYGHMDTHPTRKLIMNEIKEYLSTHQVNHKIGRSNEWIIDMSLTKFNLAPRGYGRTSYRASEIIQSGRILLYLYSDVPWIPYAGTDLDYYSLGYVAKLGNITQVIDKMIVEDDIEIQKKLMKIKVAREHYTYEGVIKQIHKFFEDPLGPQGGDLKCASIPETAHRRLRHR